MDKVISFFWGNDRMSWLRYMTLWSFRQLNPDWGMRLFVCKQQRADKYWDTPELQDFFAYSGHDYMGELESMTGIEIIDWEIAVEELVSIGPSHKSNFFKWGLLAKESGVYADLDILFVRPIDDWFSNIQNSDVAICYQKIKGLKQFSIGLLASSGSGDFYQDIYESCVRGFRERAYQSAGVMAIYRALGGFRSYVNLHWGIMCSKYPDIQFANFEMDYIYPWNSTRIAEMTSKINTRIPEQTFGIHWYAGHSLSQKMNMLLNEKTVLTQDNTIAHYAREIMKGAISG